MQEAAELDSLSPADVAVKLGISVRYLQTLFASRGLTFSASISQIRVERARRALRSDRFACCSITEIAHLFGFCDASHFNRVFKRQYGLTPSTYRNEAA
ncbi:MAG: hypothetical protein RIS94_3735 [Pseudomonadota bacterium]